MEYRINHVHIRAADPHATAAWYEKHFNARIVSEREVMPRTITIGMEMAGACRLNVSSKPPGSSDERAVAELNRLGLEHFGFDVEDIDAEIERLAGLGAPLLDGPNELPDGTRFCWVEAPDRVRVELIQWPT